MSLFWLKAIIKAVNLEERTVEGFASTMQPDMIRDVILARAWRKSLARWKKRGSIPKFLGYHQHRLLTGHSPILGPMQKLTIVPDGLMLKGEFAETELGEEHLHLYSIGAMDYFSVGFNIMPDGSTMDPAQVQRLLVANKITALVPQEVDRVITEAELFEVSAVVLGANLGALVTASADPGKCCGLCDGKAERHCNGKEERSLKVMYAKRMLERLELCAKMIADGTGAAVYENPEKYFVDDTPEEKSKGKPKEKVILSEKALEEACADVDVEDGIDELVHPKLLDLQEPDEKTGRNVADDPENVAARKRIASGADDEGTVVDPLIEARKALNPEGTTEEEKGGDEPPETTDEEASTIDSKALSPILENMKSLEARVEKLESEAKDHVENASADSGEAGGEEPQTVPATDEAKGAEDEVDGVPVLKELLTNLEKAAGK